MSRFVRRGVLRIPVAVLLLLVTQIAFAGQACRVAMFAGGDDGRAAPAMNHGGGPDAMAIVAPCCNPDSAPASTCLVPFDGAPAAIAWGHVDSPALVPCVATRAPTESVARSRRALCHPASSAGTPLPIYIAYLRFLS